MVPLRQAACAGGGAPLAERLSAAADRHVGRRLRERRVQRGLSLAEMAAALGVSTQQARKYEAGVNAIPAARLPDLAALVGVEVAWFFEELAEEGPYRPALPTRPRMLLDLVRATDEMPDAGLAALCEAARALAEQGAARPPAAEDATGVPTMRDAARAPTMRDAARAPMLRDPG